MGVMWVICNWIFKPWRDHCVFLSFSWLAHSSLSLSLFPEFIYSLELFSWNFSFSYLDNLLVNTSFLKLTVGLFCCCCFFLKYWRLKLSKHPTTELYLSPLTQHILKAKLRIVSCTKEIISIETCFLHVVDIW